MKQDGNFQDEDNDFYKTTKLDALLIGFVLFFSIICVIWITHTRSRQANEPRLALIYRENKLMKQISLQKDGVIPLLNGLMQIEVKAGRIRIVKSDCPHHICVNTGWIQHSGQTIACVPNKVLIEIKSTGPALVDAVSY